MPKVTPHPGTRSRVAYNLMRLVALDGRTMTSLADASGVPRSTIYLVRDGSSGTTLDIVGRLADGLGVDVSELFAKIPDP